MRHSKTERQTERGIERKRKERDRFYEEIENGGLFFNSPKMNSAYEKY